MRRPYAGRPRGVESLIIGAAIDRPQTTAIRTYLTTCHASPGCTAVASGWLKVNGRSVRACGECRGKGVAR